MTSETGDASFIGDQLLDKAPVSAQMQGTVEVLSAAEAMETEESPDEELDLHVCGKCKAEFTNIQLYVDHKRMVCSKRSPSKPNSLDSPSKSKRQHVLKQIITTTGAVTAIIEPQEQSFCETVIEEGVVVDDQASEQTHQDIIKAARASENQHESEKAKDNTEEKKEKGDQMEKTDVTIPECLTVPVSGVPSPFKCSTCDKEFDRPEILVVHQFMHKKFHQCTDCKRSFVSEENLNKHKREFKHVFKCKICLTEFPSQDLCKAHEASHTRQHECVDCKKKFYTEKTLERHRERVLHNLPCDTCGKVCRDRHALTKHQESHTRIKSHVCDWEACERGFRSASELNKHKKCVHLGIKEHKCEECGKEFARKDKLNRHLLIHSPNRPTYPCPFKTFTGCVKTFYRKDKLQRHIFAHSKEKPFKCDVCSKVFARKDNLTEHTRIHTGEFKHRCPVCNKGMGGPKKLLLHVQQKHSGVNETMPEKPTMVSIGCLSSGMPASTVATATADESAVTWVQENITEEKPHEDLSKSATAECCVEMSESYNEERSEEEQQQEVPQQLEQQQLVSEVEQQQQQQQYIESIQQQPSQQQSQQQSEKELAQMQQPTLQQRHVQQPHTQRQQVLAQKAVPSQPPPAQQQQAQPPVTPPKQQQQQQQESQPSPRPPPPLQQQQQQQQQHVLQAPTMVVHSSQVSPTSVTRVAVQYLSNNNNAPQARGQYASTMHQGVANVTQSETALLHEVLNELATRSLFNS